MTLDTKGRCCGKKPRVYKADRSLFCCRCHREYDIDTLEQKENWAWKLVSGVFLAQYVEADK